MGEKKESVKIGLGTLFLILIIFILATIILVMYLEKKDIIKINLKENANELISENKVENVQDVKDVNEEDKFEKIVLEGYYGPENSDVGYHFYKDGIVELHGNIHCDKGTYYTIGKNQIEIKFIKEIIYDDEGNTSEKNINRIEKGIVKDKYTLAIEYEINGEKVEYDIVRFSSDPIEQDKMVRERLEEKYSNVVYRRETEGSSGYYIKNGLVYSDTGKLTQGVVGIAKYVLPLDKQTGTGIVLTEEGKLFKSEGMGEELNTFKEVELGYKIIEIINLPDIEGYLFLAYDGTIFNIEGIKVDKV